MPYWIVLQNGKLSAGVGKVPGKQCIGTLDDSMYNMLRSGVDAVRYVGIGNSALNRNARDVRVRNVHVLSIPGHFGLEGIPMEESGFVNVFEYYGDAERERNPKAGASMPTDAELLAEYERERIKARARAQKFGIEYKEPAPDAFLRWSEARRLRANPERGFITGIDTFSTEEKAKADARKVRFAKEERKRKSLEMEHTGSDNDEGVKNEEDGGLDNEGVDDNEAPDDVADWEKTKKDPLPVEQAWDNWKSVQQFRVDPPATLYSNQEGHDNIILSSSFSNDIWHGGGILKGTEDYDEKGKDDFTREVVIVPTKVHVFAIDWAPFKQIRTDDLMVSFSIEPHFADLTSTQK